MAVENYPALSDKKPPLIQNLTPSVAWQLQCDIQIGTVFKINVVINLLCL